MKKAFLIFTLLIAVICSLCGCTTKSTVLEFTYSNSKFAYEKSLYFNEDRDTVTLNANIEIDEGTVVMQIIDKQNNRTVWEKTTDTGEAFDIELSNVVAESEYVFSIESEQIKYMHLTVTSSEKLIKDKVKPII